MAARFDRRVADVVRDAVDHSLRPRVHVLEAHVAEPGDRLQAFRRKRQREFAYEIAAAGILERIDDAVGMRLKLAGPVSPHGFRRHGREDRLALREMRFAVLAHHVVAHQLVHQAIGLMRAEYVDQLFADEDVLAVAQQCAAKLRHEGDRRLTAHSRQGRIGIVPEGGDVDIDARCGAQF